MCDAFRWFSASPTVCTKNQMLVMIIVQRIRVNDDYSFVITFLFHFISSFSSSFSVSHLLVPFLVCLTEARMYSSWMVCQLAKWNVYVLILFLCAQDENVFFQLEFSNILCRRWSSELKRVSEWASERERERDKERRDRLDIVAFSLRCLDIHNYDVNSHSLKLSRVIWRMNAVIFALIMR